MQKMNWKWATQIGFILLNGNEPCTFEEERCFLKINIIKTTNG